jgi:short-subunit dehydrogenase
MAHLLITGAASGLGAALAREGAARGHRLSLVDISPAVDDVARETGGRATIVDLADRAAAKTIYAWAPDADVLVNNAGIAASSPFSDMSPDVAVRTLMVNACAPMLLTREYLPGFRARGAGTIVNVSSSAAYFPTPGLAPYGATKAFLTAFSEALIVECAAWPGVHVIGFCPSGRLASGTRAPASCWTRTASPPGCWIASPPAGPASTTTAPVPTPSS